jgi:putative redox protein
MLASVKWNSRMSFTGIADSGFPISLDTDESVGGNNSAGRPMELIALGLAGCTAMDVISILQKKRQEVTSFEVKVDASRANEHPKVFTSAVIRYVITGKNIDEAALVRAIELSAVKYCPAQAMLAKAFPMELRYEIFEDGPQPKLVKEAVLELP